jgi:outer membrane protein assembly factor BamB
MRLHNEWVAGGLAALVLSFNSLAADWPQWRGPGRDAVAHETGLLRQWPTNGPALLWELKGLGTGFSGLAISGGRFYTMGDLQDGGRKSQYIIAFDLANRSRAWIARVGPPHDDGPRCTPTVDGDLVYALGTDGDLLCVRATTGQEVWRKNLPRDFQGEMMSGWKYSESPLVDGEKLVCTPGGKEAAMVASNKKTGEVIWKCRPPNPESTGGAGYASIVVSEGAGVRQYVTVMGRGAVGVSAADGKLLWTYGRVANGTANIPTPVVDKDFVFVSTAYGAGAALLKLSKTEEGIKAGEVYFLRADTFQCHHGGFLKVGDYIYGAHGHGQGNPICLEMATGRVQWKAKQLGSGSGAVLYADGLLFYRYEDDTVALIGANPQEYVLKGVFKAPHRPGMEGPGWVHPVVLEGKLYLRHNDVLLCYDVHAGA